MSRDADQIEIFVISLPWAQERRESIRAQFQAQRLAFRFVDAVDGTEGLPAEYEHLVDRELAVKKMGRPLSETELACALSHALVYQTILKEGLGEALVLEDDIKLGEDFAFLVRSGCLAGMKKDLVLLNHKHSLAFKWSFRPLPRDYQSFQFAVLPNMAAAYYLTNRGASQLCRAALPISFVADWPLLIPFRMRSAGIHPCPVYHGEFGSQQVGREKQRPAEFRSLLKTLKFRGLKAFLSALYFRWVLPRVAVWV